MAPKPKEKKSKKVITPAKKMRWPVDFREESEDRVGDVVRYMLRATRSWEKESTGRVISITFRLPHFSIIAIVGMPPMQLKPQNPI